jgi:hypothetical protein
MGGLLLALDSLARSSPPSRPPRACLSPIIRCREHHSDDEDNQHGGTNRKHHCHLPGYTKYGSLASSASPAGGRGTTVLTRCILCIVRPPLVQVHSRPDLSPSRCRIALAPPPRHLHLQFPAESESILLKTDCPAPVAVHLVCQARRRGPDLGLAAPRCTILCKQDGGLLAIDFARAIGICSGRRASRVKGPNKPLCTQCRW